MPRHNLLEQINCVFACLEVGHMSRECRQRLFCKHCKGRPPTSLHKDAEVISSAKCETEQVVVKQACSSTGVRDEGLRFGHSSDQS